MNCSVLVVARNGFKSAESVVTELNMTPVRFRDLWRSISNRDEAGHLVTALEPADNVFLVARRAHDPKVTDSLTSLPPPPLHAQAKPSSGKGPLARLEPFGSGKDGGLYVSVGEQPGS